MLELLAEDLRSGAVDLDDALELLERARAQSRRLGRLAADLLDLSRIDADVQLRSEPVELGELSRAVLAEFELGSQERGVGCVLQEREGPVWALGDPGSIAQILRILLDNALRVAPGGSEIGVTLRAGTAPTLSVSDHGPGVPDEEREMIFERFKRGTWHRRRGRLRPRSGDRPRARGADGRNARHSTADDGARRDVHAEPASRAGTDRRSVASAPLVAPAPRGGPARQQPRRHSWQHPPDGRTTDAGDARRRRPPLVVPRPPRGHRRRARAAAARQARRGCSTPAAARAERSSSSLATARCQASS